MWSVRRQALFFLQRRKTVIPRHAQPFVRGCCALYSPSPQQPTNQPQNLDAKFHFSSLSHSVSKRNLSGGEWRHFSTVRSDDDDDDEEDMDPDDKAKREKEDLERAEFASKMKGRLWEDPWDIEDLSDHYNSFDDIPDWTYESVSRISHERVQIHPEKIPTLSSLAKLPLPQPPTPHPGDGHAKVYALQRKRRHYRYILEQVKLLAEPRIQAIQALPTWEEKQDAVDELFETVEFELKEKEEILGKHPYFGKWVEKALEEFLRTTVAATRKSQQQQQHLKDEAAAENNNDVDSSGSSSSSDEDSQTYPSAEQDRNAVPVFIELFNDKEDTSTDIVPKILHPLKKWERGYELGRMVEEWYLAAHKTSKRIMIRQATRAVARALVDNEQARIYVHGKRGVGKTAALAAIVASARKSGYLVLYMPDGDQLCKNGYYIEPNEKRPGTYDLPLLSTEVCEQFLKSHRDDLQGFRVGKETLREYFTDDQLAKLPGYSGKADAGFSLVELLELATERKRQAAMCFSAAVDVLMKQDQKPFLIVLDEANCYFGPGHYFHMDYDFDVKKSIPYNQINLFKPALDAMALSVNEDEPAKPPVMMKRGGVIIGTTESHAVPRKTTDALTENVRLQVKSSTKDGAAAAPLYEIHVPRLSSLEVEHMLSNYECIGVGKLRMDQGETVMNEQEVAYLRMISGSIPQQLMEACIIE